MISPPDPSPVPAEPRVRSSSIAKRIAFVGVIVGCVAGFFLYQAFTRIRDAGMLKDMIPRQAASARAQFFLENGDRIFVSYAELFGPEGYVRSYNAVDGEDLSAQFPLRRDWCEAQSVSLPDGITVTRHEVIAAISPRGLIATYPRP